MIVTATRAYDYKELVDVVKALEGQDFDRFLPFFNSQQSA